MKLHKTLSDLVDEIRAGNRDLPAPAAELVLELAGAVDALSERIAVLEAAAVEAPAADDAPAPVATSGKAKASTKPATAPAA